MAVNSFAICNKKPDHLSGVNNVNMTEVNKALWTAQVDCTVGVLVIIFLMSL